MKGKLDRVKIFKIEMRMSLTEDELFFVLMSLRQRGLDNYTRELTGNNMRFNFLEPSTLSVQRGLTK